MMRQTYAVDGETSVPKPTIVYLDSNDYSTLSESALDERSEGLRSRLKALRSLPDVTFAFSAAHISEMAPVQDQYAEAGVRRTSLLVDLCGRNAMISFDRLIKAELTNLVSKGSEPVQAVDTNGEWFPDFRSLITPVDALDIAGIVNKTAQESNLNRQARRALKRQMINKDGSLRSTLDQMLQQDNIAQALEQFPMRDADARILMQYVAGSATRAQANTAFLESLRDPSFMARWFINHHAKLGAVGAWVRDPAQKLINTLQATLAEWHTRLAGLDDENRRDALQFFNGTKWARTVDENLLGTANRLLGEILPTAGVCNDVRQVEKYCPGLTIGIRTLYESLRRSTGDSPRKLMNSDFVDAVHAMYVPYVSMFRADKYMASIIAPLAKPCGTAVYSKISQLVEALEAIPVDERTARP